MGGALTGVIILAGGNAERMHYPKPYLFYKGKTFLKHISDTYREAGIEKVIIVLNKKYSGLEWKEFLDPLKTTAKIVINENPELERLYSVKLGADQAEGFDYCFLQDCDRPFVTPDLIHVMMENRKSAGVTVPFSDGKGGHPVLISRPVLGMLSSLRETGFGLNDVLRLFDRKLVPVQEECIHWNINTEYEYRKYACHDLTASSLKM